jgi:hypothetical protein
MIVPGILAEPGNLWVFMVRSPRGTRVFPVNARSRANQGLCLFEPFLYADAFCWKVNGGLTYQRYNPGRMCEAA